MLEKLTRRLRRSGLQSPSTDLYIEGIKCKFRLARHCIDVLSQIEHSNESMIKILSESSTSTINIDTDHQVLFYCDSFWNLLRSSIDILAQLINELRSLGINERQVYFDNVKNRIRSNEPNSPLQISMRNLERSRVFRDLNEYRRCVTHRRPVFVEKAEQQITYSTTPGTPGYSTYVETSDKLSILDRYLCNNPWDINPTPDFKRPVLAFNNNLLQKIEKRMITIIKRIP